MFGQNFVQTIQELKKYVIKYGDISKKPQFPINSFVSMSTIE
jgi:hypothetical protein